MQPHGRSNSLSDILGCLHAAREALDRVDTSDLPNRCCNAEA
ncbi:hypothetical protein APHMUC_0578 [Anaplasma phagocytophilum str. ApMUC09]|uniref:Uncharacterized protein n=1 Tax=Anaplasma phagocytophilum str. ApMUC09 TaxID=1359152 RepID=A0A0F3NB15_ANAPH|nr:hypothetical protein APHMUC_0578 [Anaplasma phagocytophilum str. ApMUC09]